MALLKLWVLQSRDLEARILLAMRFGEVMSYEEEGDDDRSREGEMRPCCNDPECDGCWPDQIDAPELDYSGARHESAVSP